MTPLVDVVMVILIFLMLTGSFGMGAFFLPSNAPIRSSGKGEVTSEVPKIPDPQLDIYIATLDNNTYKVRVGSGEEFFNGVARTSGRKLVDVLRELKAKQENPDKLQVVLAPRLSTRYKHIIEVYQTCMEAKCPKIGFQTARD